MVCAEDDPSTKCIVKTISTQTKHIFVVRPNYTVKDFLRDIAVYSDSPNFQLLLETSNNKDFILLNDLQDKTLLEVGVNFDYGSQNNFLLRPMKEMGEGEEETGNEVTEKITINTLPMTDSMSDDDLALGASASPTEPADSAPIPNPPPLPLMFHCDNTYDDVKPNKVFKERRKTTAFVGLVNQAMTCYLNSLLQALYMTPEFRNALYNWEFDGVGESKSIPYQLQKLFLKLQTSEKPSIETTDLTRSFGWDSTEAWQQHDIQELCRVMFDALEQKFKNTQQADLINRLYQGKMIDYVKCLECGTEKSREDTFLDIPLSVKPFGSTVAYGSVEEALRAFVQPETLEENNQYSCDTCNKKCNAHKGLKFSQFPYILTLHLKRFDFDYQTLRRIKLNDKVTFPQTLNLNNLVNTSNPGFGSSVATAEGEVTTKVSDDCSTVTTDSGSALEEENCSGTTTITNNDHDIQEDDEGIDMSTSTDHKSSVNHSSGPFIYELFSIMIHSGSASGGHYYAYIKDFESGEWYCFNDQTVSSITQEDIQKSFGGGRAFYSGAYSSSINAYMLMYRQIDPQRNTNAMSKNDFPQHIKDLVERLDKQQSEPYRSGNDYSMKLKVYYSPSDVKRLTYTTIDVLANSSLDAVLHEAHIYTQVSAPIDHCRLVAYDRDSDSIIRSFEGHEQDPIDKVWQPYSLNDLLLEVRESGETFKPYEPDGISTKVFLLDLITRDIDGPFNVRAKSGRCTVREFKNTIKECLALPETSVLHMAYTVIESVSLFKDDEDILSKHIVSSAKIFVTTNPVVVGEESEKTFKNLTKQYSSVLTIHVLLPDTDQKTLDEMCIPAYKPKTPTRTTTPVQETLPVPENGEINGASSSPLPEPESNSEDSSLSDGDRTLVESLPCANTSPQSSSCTENGDDSETNFAFKAFPSTKHRDNMKILVDKHMQIGMLKTCLEPYVGVPKKFFKIIRKTLIHTDFECTRMTESLIGFKEGDTITIELGRVLKDTEHMCKVYFLKLAEINDDMEKLPIACDWILEDGTTVSDTKMKLLKHLATLDEKKYGHLTPERCRLRKKSWRNVGKIYQDDQIFNDDIRLTTNLEMVLQEVDDMTPTTVDTEDTVLFLRRWNPSTLTLDPLREVAFKPNCELRKMISELSGIPLENVEYDKVSGVFPRNTIPLTSMNTVLEWTSAVLDYEMWSVTDGNIFYYRDSKEELKEITAEERRLLAAKDTLNTTYNSSTSSTYSPRRERALKIYLDLSPKKQGD